MITAQAALETRTLLRNGEQLLLTLIIPVLLLIAFSLEPLVKVRAARRVDFLVPGIIALAVMSTAFTSQAIATGFERRYGVLKRLGATPLSRGGLIAAKTAHGDRRRAGAGPDHHRRGPGPGLAPARRPGGRRLGGAAGAGRHRRLQRARRCCWPGTLRAEATLAAANLIYLVLLGVGGIIFPLTKFPAAARPVLTLLPSGALSDGLHSVLQHGAGAAGARPGRAGGVGGGGIALAARTFRWE